MSSSRTELKSPTQPSPSSALTCLSWPRYTTLSLHHPLKTENSLVGGFKTTKNLAPHGTNPTWFMRMPSLVIGAASSRDTFSSDRHVAMAIVGRNEDILVPFVCDAIGSVFRYSMLLTVIKLHGTFVRGWND